MRPEDADQAALFDWITMYAIKHEPLCEWLIFSVPNGATLAGNPQQRARQMNRLKRTGLVPGVADILCLIPKRGYPFMALELKTLARQDEKDGGLSENQAQFLTAVRLAGGLDKVCYGADDAIETLGWYLGLSETPYF